MFDRTKCREARADLGAHVLEQGRAEEGRKLLERALKAGARRPVPECKRSRVLLGHVRLKQDKAKDALRLAREERRRPWARGPQP